MINNTNMQYGFFYTNDGENDIAPKELVQQELITYLLTENGIKKTTVKRSYKVEGNLESYSAGFLGGNL